MVKDKMIKDKMIKDKMIKDKIFSQPIPHLVDFKFDEKVASVFPDMIRRSIPGYDNIIAMTGMIAACYAKPNTRIYDLGSSIGASTSAILQQLDQPRVNQSQVNQSQVNQPRLNQNDVELICVDNSPDMLLKCKNNLENKYPGRVKEYLECDVKNLKIERASVVVMNFILQFMEPDCRLALLQKVFAGMISGGVIILSEKTLPDKNAAKSLQDQLHVEFKRANGYSDLEIAQKRNALENVMVLDTLKTHIERLELCGFAQIEQWFQALHFRSLIAVKL